ncbi:hypothetical protein F5Y08DRAFT_205929 [Xylaria arbuscula]|nr:hypothetical protein F5Y08DRAFT_205929 [Xylaria arbuscula]
MFPRLIRRLATSSSRSSSSSASPPIAPKFRNTTSTNPAVYAGSSRYRPKKVWPPDFSKLSRKEQFRFEKRYKRRVRLATARPRWDKFVRLAQLGSVTFVLVYSILFMDWNTEKQPFEGIRSRFWGAIDALSPEQRHVRQSPDIPTTASQR